MLKKIKELFGFPTEQEKIAAKNEAGTPKLFVDGHNDVREVTPVLDTNNTSATEAPAKVKKPRVVKPKAEKAPVEETPVAKKPAAKKPAAKKPAAKKPATRKAKASVVGSGDVKQS